MAQQLSLIGLLDTDPDLRELAETCDAGRVTRRALTLIATSPDRLAAARAFGARMVAAWWRGITTADRKLFTLRARFQGPDRAELPKPAVALAEAYGEALAHLHAEVAAHKIGLAYTGLLPAEHRTELGIYYTPPALTARLIALATDAGVDWSSCRILDPACGGGAFLAPVARCILERLANCAPRVLLSNLAARLRGYEIDPFGAWLSQVTLDAVLLPLCREAGRRLPVVVTVCNSLRRSVPRERFDLVIGNPPYRRLRLDPADRIRYRRGLYGHANLYGLFTDVALRYARPGGVVAYVTPTSFLAGEYFKRLRALLGREAPPRAIDFVACRKGVFEDVLQETLLATYRIGASPGPVKIHEIKTRNEGTLAVEAIGEFALPADLSRPWLLPRSASRAPLIGKLFNMRHRLADWGYSVSTGPLVWNRHKSQLADLPGPNRYPLVWAEAVTSLGSFLWRAEKKNHTLYFETLPGDEWLTIDQPCILVQRTTAKEQNRRLIAAALPAAFIRRHRAVVVENHLNMLRPRVEHPRVPAAVLAALLNSAAVDRAFRCVSGSVAVSAYELEALPLPDPEDLAELTLLVKGNAARHQIETVCERIYDRS
jgi:adenine-specific DNA-methyltransferase